MTDFELTNKNDLFDIKLRIQADDATCYLSLNKTSKNAFMRDQVACIALSDEQLTELTKFLTVWAQRKDSGK